MYIARARCESQPAVVSSGLNARSQKGWAIEFCFFYTPAPRKVEWGYTGFTPMSVRPSVRPSVCRKFSGTFWKKLLAQFISYLAFTLLGLFWVSWPLFIFVFLASFLALWWPNIWPKMGFPEHFEKNYCLNPFHTWHLPSWGEFLDPSTFSCS